MKATRKLHELGQSVWLDNITRDLLTSGTLKRYIADLSLTGLTSNPTIFDHAIKNSSSYDSAIRSKLNEGKSGESLFFELAIEDLAQAADLFRPIWDRTNGVDGWVSLEVSPLLAHDTASTIAAAKELHARAKRPNLFIKIPGTREGLPAIEEAIFAGVPVNVTLLFSREHYLAAAEAYLRGVERRIAAGLNPNVGSVASVFISRWDAAVANKVPAPLHNQLGIAIAKRTYKAACELIGSARSRRIYNEGGAATASVVGEHRNQGPGGVGRPVRQGARRAAHGQHHAGRHGEGPRRSRRDWRDVAGRWRRLRRGAVAICEGRRRCRRAGGDIAGRGRQVVCQILERTDGCDLRQDRSAQEGKLGPNRDKGPAMNILVIDVGGTHVKILASGETEKREIDSGPETDGTADGFERQEARGRLEI